MISHSGFAITIYRRFADSRGVVIWQCARNLSSDADMRDAGGVGEDSPKGAGSGLGV